MSSKKIFALFKDYILILTISLLPVIFFLFSSSLYHTHDGLVHLPRIGAYFKALQDGQIPVRWAGDLNYGYGMPLFNFIYQTPYLISSVFLLLGFGLVNAFKVTLILSYLLSGIFMLAFSKAFFKDNKKAFLATIFYQFYPFRFVELLIRGSFGEVYTYVFLPLVLWGLVLIHEKVNFQRFFLISASTALLVLSHNSVSLVFFGVCLLFVIFLLNKNRSTLFSVGALFTGLIFSSFYWFPALIEHKYTYGDLFMKEIYMSHFAPIQNFFIPNITNNVLLQTEGISVQIGLFHIIALIIAIYILIKNKANNSDKKLYLFCIFLLFMSFLFMQPISKVLWENVSILRQFQFPWRFLSVVGISTSLLSVAYFYLPIIKKKVIYFILIFLVVVSTVFYWFPSLGVDKVKEDYYWNFPLNTTYYGETDVIWSAGSAKAYPKQRAEIISGKGSIGNIVKKSNNHKYLVNAQTDVLVVDHTQYFPGWRVLVDNKPVTIQFQDQNWRGEIIFPVVKGSHNIEVSFGESKVRLFSDILSLGFFVLFFLILIYKSRKYV